VIIIDHICKKIDCFIRCCINLLIVSVDVVAVDLKHLLAYDRLGSIIALIKLLAVGCEVTVINLIGIDYQKKANKY